MYKSILSGLAALSLVLVTGCTTKVYNTPPAAQSTVIEKDRPIVVEQHDRPSATPDVQNNIRVER